MLRWWRQLTVRGRTFLVSGAVSTVVLAILNQSAMLWISTLLLVLPIIALVITSGARLSLGAGRTVQPARTPVGHGTTVELDVKQGASATPALLHLEDRVDPELGPRPRFSSHRVFGRWRRRVSYRLPATVRGIWRVGPLLVRVTDPFGLTRVDRAFTSTADVIVTPEVWALPSIRIGGGSGAVGGETPHRLGLSGTDDVLVRELRQGDDLRRVHWRSTAKFGELMVRREEQALHPAITVLLDSRRSAWPGELGEMRFEWAVSATTSITQHLMAQGLSVSLLDADGQRATSSHDDPDTNAEEVLLAMTNERTSGRATLDYTLNRQPPTSRSRALIAILGVVTPEDVVTLLTGRRNVNGGALILSDGDSGAQLHEFLSAGWSAHQVTPGQTVPEAWAALGGVR